MDRPRVLILITLPETGGAQAYVASLVPALVAEFDVTVAAHGEGWLADAARRGGARYVPLRHLQRALDPRADLLALAELIRLIRRERPLIVHANSSKAGIIGRIAAVVTRVPVRLFTVHGWAFKAHSGAAAWLYLWADRLMRPLTTMTICVAESERQAGLRARTCRRATTVVIHNGVGLDRPRRTGAAQAGPATLLSVGRLREPKDFTTLVRAVATCEPGSVRLLVAGDGPDRPGLTTEIARLGLDGAVELLGTRDDVDQLLAAADLFVLSSRSEGMPMSVLEAMAAGVPVIASAVGGIPELVRDGETGALVPPGDPDRLGGAIRRLAGDPALRQRYGEAGRARAEREFALENCRQAHLELYRSVLRR
jgi:glycosyltransferase involved in cell wall biosynthesis